MDRRFPALIAVTFVVAFAVCWFWFAPAAPTPAPVAQNVPSAPVATSSPAIALPPAATQDPPPPPPRYKPEPDPTVVHRLG